MRFYEYIFLKHRAYLRSEDGVAAVEAAFVFPILLVLLLGIVDMGRGIMCNMKTIKASQVAADLIARDITVDVSIVNEALEAGTLALLPYSTATLGFDVVSVRFPDNNTTEIVWQETRNTTPMTLAQVQTRTRDIRAEGSGALIVVARYLYKPIFAGFVVDQIQMEEVAFARGRRSAVVCMTGAPGCSAA